MEGMTTLSLESAHELVSLIAKRERLKAKLVKCEKKLYHAMGRLATQCTGVHEGESFVFRGTPAVLTGWLYECLPTDLLEVQECIGAYIRTEPDTTKGPRHFTSRELMVSDFSKEERPHEEA